MKKITVIGVGKLGICLSLNLEKKGYNVLGVEKNIDYINQVNEKIFYSSEPKVSEMLKNSKNFRLTNDLEEGLKFSDIIFILVSTPSLPDGKYDHSQVDSVLTEIKKLGYTNKRKNLIIGCTTYPGYCESIFLDLDKLNYSIVYNPEFIAQGNIIDGQTYPDLVLIGESDIESGKIVEDIHLKLCENNPKICRMGLTEAELTKLSINCFITTKISFANMIGDLCNKLNISHKNVLEAVGSDTRIGNKYLNWGFGFGGPCFPRDNRALGILCEENNINPKIPKASDEYNILHNQYHSEFLILNEIENQKFILDGASYKKNSVLIDESQQLKVAELLNNCGIEVTIKDVEEVIEQVKKINGDKYKYEKK